MIESKRDPRIVIGAPVEADAQAEVVWLHDPAASSVRLVGSKAANLAKLRQHGFPVPAGFVVPTDAFEQHAASLPVASVEALGTAILDRPMASLLADRIADALDELGTVSVAVRSSGVAEDLQGTSFAGQYDSFLGLRGVEQVSEAIRKCWASAFSERVRRYHEEKYQEDAQQGATEPRPEPMAVLVQVMVEADAAGVAFTANPVTGERNETIVSAVEGLGERLVSGEASPDEWFVRNGRAEARSTPEQAIDERQVLRVADLARKVEEYFGEPQDIEWAFRGEELFLLQARPITAVGARRPAQSQTVAPPMVPVPIEHPAGYWEREESHYPDPISPATRSTFVPAVNRAFRFMCSEFSLMIETLEQREIGGWLYQRAVPLGGKDMPTPPAWLVPLLIRVVPRLRDRIRGSVQAVREDKAGRMIELWERDWRPELIRERDRLAVTDLAALDDAQLEQHLEDARRFMESSLLRHMLLNGAIQLSLADFAFACRDLLGWDDTRAISVFSGLSETSSAPARSLARLAEEARKDPKLMAEIVGGSGVTELRERHPDFMRRFDEHIGEFGCRALRNELAFPTLGESPELMLRLLRDQIEADYEPDEGAKRLQDRRQALLGEARELLRGASEEQRTRFEEALLRAEKAYPVREEHGFYDRDAPVALLRYALIETGRRLAERGQLDDANDVFFLEFGEVLPALAQGGPVGEVVERRKAERNWALAHPGPPSYGKLPPAPPSLASFPEEARRAAEGVFWALEHTFATRMSGRVQQNDRNIEGIAASGGRYTGTVRVITDESLFHLIQPGDVLVCPITSPVWSVVFPSIGALVTDSGGMLSHSAIIAREYGIPAVVATGNATELLVDGQRVTVDGAAGVIEAL